MFSSTDEKQVEISTLDVQPANEPDEYKNQNIEMDEARSLQYLHVFDEEELVELEKKYHPKTRFELDEIVVNHPKIFWWYRIDYCIANSSNLLYILFQINTSNQGIIQFVQTLSPGAVVPNDIAYGIGASTAILDTGMYLVVFSAYKEAVISTLDYFFSLSTKNRLQAQINFIKSSPQQAAISLIKTLANQIVLYTVDFTGVMTEIVDIADKILKLPTPLNWLVIGGILHYGKRFYSKYMDDDYLMGLDFWKHNDKQPWLYQEVLKGNIAIPSQILLQGASCIGLRAYPYFYYLAVASSAALGWWPPALFVVSVVVWHSLSVLYPQTYNHYLADQIAVESLLKKKFLPTFANVLASELDVKLRNEMDVAIKSYHDEIIAKQGRLFLFRQEPMMLVPIAYRSAVSGYMGYQLGLLASVGPLALPIVSAFVCATILGGSLYKAEESRIMYKLIRAIEEVDARTNVPMQFETRGERLSGYLAKLLNVDAAFSNAMATVGAGSRLPSNTPLIMAVTGIIAIERALNMIKFNEKRVEKTVKSLLLPKNGCFSSARQGLFHRNKVLPELKIVAPSRVSISPAVL